MKISDEAAAAGCSPRIVRYYHRTGVLPEPPRTSAGYRDYQLSDVALLLKLRTLTDAGIPAAALHGVLTRDTSVRADVVQDALDNVDEEITRLHHQRGRLFAMQGGTSGIPTDIQGLQLMADAGVTTPETWELLRRTLVDGDVPLATTNIPTTGAQRTVLTDLVKHMEPARRSR